MKHLLSTAAFLFGAVASSTAIAQGMEETGKTPDASASEQFSSETGIDVSTTNIEGRAVVDNAGEEIGDIDRLVKDGEEKKAIIGLSDGMKEVAVPLNQLSVTHEKVTVNLSKSELESYEDIDPLQFETLNEDEISASDFGSSTTIEAGTSADAGMPADDRASDEDYALNSDTMGTDAGMEGYQSETDVTADTQEYESDAAVSAGTEYESDAEVSAGTEYDSDASVAAGAGAAGASSSEEFANETGIDVSTTNIEGRDVLDNTGEEIGDIDRLVKDGEEKKAVIGLSDSMKEVAVSLSEFTLSGSDNSITVNLSRDELLSDSYKDVDPLDFETISEEEISASDFGSDAAVAADASAGAQSYESDATMAGAAGSESYDSEAAVSAGASAEPGIESDTAMSGREESEAYGADAEISAGASTEYESDPAIAAGAGAEGAVSTEDQSWNQDQSGDASLADADLEGKDVVDASGETIGGIDRVVTEGSERKAIIGLSDSLKEVAVPVNELSLAADGNVSVNLSRDELEAYEDVDPMDYEEADVSE